MKPENIKKVWDYYQQCKMSYLIRYSRHTIAAINKNIEGDFSPSLFYDDDQSRVHIIVQEYIKYLLEQEAIEETQQQEIPMKQNNQPRHPLSTHKKRRHNHNTPLATQWKAGAPRRVEVVKSHQTPALKFAKKILGEVSRSDEGVISQFAGTRLQASPNQELPPKGHYVKIKKLSLFLRGSPTKWGGG